MILIGEKFIPILPIKMKYFKQGFFETLKHMEKHTLTELSNYSDGTSLFNLFLTSIFDDNQTTIDYVNKNINDAIYLEIIKLTKDVNELNKEPITEKIDNKKNKSKDKNKLSFTYKRLYAVLGVYCGLSERELDECSYAYFNDCINELAFKLRYESSLYIVGNSNYDANDAKITANNCNPFSFDPSVEVKPRRLTLKDIQASGISIVKVEGVKLINDMEK